MGTLGIYTGPAVVAIGLVVVVALAAVSAARLSWQCESCGKVSNPFVLKVVFAKKNNNKKIMRCPHCKQQAKMRPVQKQKWA